MSSASVGEGKTIAVLTNGFNVYTRYLASGVRKGLEGTGYKFVGRQSNFDADREVANFEELISIGVAGIIVLPHTLKSSGQGYAAAKKAGIPIVDLIGFEAPPPDQGVIARLRNINPESAHLLAKWITQKTDPCEILIVSSVPGQGFSEIYTRWFSEGLQLHGKGRWNIVDNQPGYYNRFTAMRAARKMLAAHPDAKVIVDYAAEMGIGIASYLKKEDRRGIVTITSDGVEEMLPWMKEGWLTASRFYSPAEHGLAGVRVLRNYIENGKKPNGGVLDVDLSGGIVTNENVDDWVQKLPLCYDEHMVEVAKIP
jgi:ABC-type sugar transport system substrate-binding protein